MYGSESRAVDGYTNRDYEAGFCFAITEKHGWAARVWWMVDFGYGSVHVIHNVTIFNVIWPDAYEPWEMRNFTLAVSMSWNIRVNPSWHTCAHHPGHFTEPQKTLECSASGRFLKIENGGMANGFKMFGMCEVVVMGYKAIGK